MTRTLHRFFGASATLLLVVAVAACNGVTSEQMQSGSTDPVVSVTGIAAFETVPRNRAFDVRVTSSNPLDSLTATAGGVILSLEPKALTSLDLLDFADLATGEYDLVVVATDSEELSTTSTLPFSVDRTLPDDGEEGGEGGGGGPVEPVLDPQVQVSLSTPAAGAQVRGSAVTVTARVDTKDFADGEATRVRFDLGGTLLIGTVTATPLDADGEFSVTRYTLTFDSTPFADGESTLTVTAENADGTVTAEASATVVVSNDPSASWNAPAPGLALLGGPVRIVADLDGERYPLTWSVAALSGDSRVVVASGEAVDASAASIDEEVDTTGLSSATAMEIVVEDRLGYSSTSAIDVTFVRPVRIAFPSADSTVTGTVQVQIDVETSLFAPSVTILSVDLSIDSSSDLPGSSGLANGATADEYVYDWNTCAAAPGAHDPTTAGERTLAARVVTDVGTFYSEGVAVDFVVCP